MKTCYKCNKKDYNNNYERTTDNKDVCLRCMGEVQDHYHKGLLSSEEINKYYELKKEYDNKRMELILIIKKQAKQNNEDPREILKEVMQLEETLSLKSYNKGKGFHKATINLEQETFEGRIPLTMEEHYLLITQIIDNFDLIRPAVDDDIRIVPKDHKETFSKFLKTKYKPMYSII